MIQDCYELGMLLHQKAEDAKMGEKEKGEGKIEQVLMARDTSESDKGK